MPNCDFYALAEDCKDILDFIFAQPGWTLYELYSQWDKPVRVFSSTESVRDTFNLCKESTHFQLYAPDMGGSVHYRRIERNAGETVRNSTEGWGLIQVYFGDLSGGLLTNSHTNHNSETRAYNWSVTLPDLGDVGEWDWSGVERTSGKLVRFIRKLGVAKQGSRPVLKQAYESLRSDAIRFQ